MLVATLAAGCTSITDRLPGRGETATVEPAPVPDGQEELAAFYEQQLDWVDCGSGECAELVVPLSYAEPGGETIEVSVLKVPASSSRNRLGSLLVNPGGPGGSGVDYAAAADFIVGPEVRRRYDIIGFDPRGVGRSAPVDCVSDAELDDYLGMDLTPDDEAEQREAEAVAESFAQSCDRNVGALLGNISTVDVTRDMDILRAALGEEQFAYLGRSYGTYLGAVYAEQFPEGVGRFVLDGALPPDLTSAELSVGQAEGFERATRAWAADCIDEGDCPLGDTVDEVMAGLGDLLERLDADPMPVTGDARIRAMSEGWASYGMVAAMYDQGRWAFLTDALRAVVEADDATELMDLANEYARRTPSGAYTSNIMEAFVAVSCLDRPGDSEGYLEALAEAQRRAPLWGEFMIGPASPCDFWPHEPVGGGPRTIEAPGTPPMVVVGTTRDPATPFEWSEQLAEQLASGVMVTFDGDGHTAYTRGNACVDDLIDAFYVDGTVPPDGITC